MRKNMTRNDEIEKSLEEWKKEIEELRKDTKRPRKIEEEVRKQLFPLFFDFYPSSAKYKMFWKFNPVFLEKSVKAKEFMVRQLKLVDIFNKKCLKSKLEGELEYRTFLSAMTYLLEVELIGNAYIDETLLLLIAGGIDLHLEPDNKHWVQLRKA